jgi:hypothetical protein
MATTRIRQNKQIRNSETYDDSLSDGDVMETSPIDIQTDLNNLRSQIRRLIDASGKWYDDPITDVKTLANNAGSGWIYIYDLQGNSGVVISNKVYQDTGNNVLQSATASGGTIRVLVRASYPLVTINSIATQLTRAVDNGFYYGYADLTLTVSADIVAKVTTPDDTDGPHDTIHIALDLPPDILTLSFTGSYPGSQTELKSGDTFSITGTTSVPAVGVEILDYEACSNSVLTFSSNTTFTVSGIIANRGNTTITRPARLKARNAAGAYGATRDTNTGGGSTDGVDVVKCNNLHPTVTFGTVTYPSSQTALKDSETATIVVTTANLDTIAYTSPNSQLSITNPSTIESPKTVQRIAGNYNVSTSNLRAEAVRTANDAHTVSTTVIRIAHVAASISVSEPYTRLRLGNPNADYTITITSDQELPSAPTLDSDTSPNSGVLQGTAWVGGLLTYTRTLRVSNTSVPGTYSWLNLSATNRSGIATTSITGDASYVLGGSVARSVTFPPFSQTTSLDVPITNYSKLQAGIFTATNQQSTRNATLGNHSNIANTYTIEALDTNPTTVFWNDKNMADTNSTGTAQLLSIEETV